MSATLYPLGLDRLEWAARRELVMTMREAFGVVDMAARMIGCGVKRIVMALSRYQVEPSEYGGEPFPVHCAGEDRMDLMMRDVMREEIIKVLQETAWNKGKAAKRLGISRNTLYNRLSKLQIQLHE